MNLIITSHPNPQFARENWQSLNGQWDFGFQKRRGSFRFSKDEMRAKEKQIKNEYTHKINVPFCLQSELSGIGYTNFVKLVWYRKKVVVRKEKKRVFLCIGAADYLTTVLVNSNFVGRHKGGYTSFSFDITDFVTNGENEIFLLCEDDEKNPLVARGKQSEKRESHGCDYTRTTGIWQSVYLEYVPERFIRNFKIYPDFRHGLVTVAANLNGRGNFACEAFYNGKPVGKAELNNAAGNAIVQIKLNEIHLWETGKGRLYELKLTFDQDIVFTYFGLRNVRLDGFRFLLNETSVFQRLVLDQGFYKKGIYTAQDDEEMVRDIALSQSLGFNGARLHQKVFDPRFLYFCDKMGYLVWGEYANWGLNYANPKSVAAFLEEWGEALHRDFNHPSIIGWCPFNETWDYKGKRQYDPLISAVYDYTKAVDATRPCIDTSGNFHVKTDIYDVHDYSYDTRLFQKNYNRLMTEGYLYEHVLKDHPGRQKYGGQPVFISEYGGIKWQADKGIKAWGYGEDVKMPAEFLERYRGLANAILFNSKMFGFCYTQLYDVEQERNGLFTYERQKKFSDEIYEKIKEVNRQPAAIEKDE